jgi:hypothetical protein
MEAQLRIAGALAEFDADRSFAIIGSAIDHINELMAATALLASFNYSSVAMNDEEFTMDSSTTIQYGFSALASKDILKLAEIDFERTKETFGRFQRPELRVRAYLLIASSILVPEPAYDDCTCQEQLRKLRRKAAGELPPR